MNCKDVHDEIDRYGALLRKYLDGELTGDERRQLGEWLWADRSNRELLKRLRSVDSLRERHEMRQQVDAGHEFRLLSRRYPRLKRRKISRLWRYAVAVSVLLAVAGGNVWLNKMRVPGKEIMVPVAPGKAHALLTTADGKVMPIGLDEGVKGVSGFRVQDSVKRLICEKSDTRHATIRYHRLDVPRGGEFNVLLADGTRVRLNSESYIRFPESFGDSVRSVEVGGEVYLEVARDAARPFIVDAGKMKTRVLGTRFGVRVYPGEDEWTTTLAEGSVRVDLERCSLILKPGQQARARGGQLEKLEVDVDKELAWVRGLFVFEHDRLIRVTERLSRWYDVVFRFDDASLKSYQFTGTVSRDMGIDKILDLIERMNVVKFEKKDSYIVIKTNDKVRKYY